MLLYMRQEGRGIGLINKLRPTVCRTRGRHRRGQPSTRLETTCANTASAPDPARPGRAPHAPDDQQPAQTRGSGGYGIDLVDRVPLQIQATDMNLRYLRTKKDRMGHLLDGLDDKMSESQS